MLNRHVGNQPARAGPRSGDRSAKRGRVVRTRGVARPRRRSTGLRRSPPGRRSEPAGSRTRGLGHATNLAHRGHVVRNVLENVIADDHVEDIVPEEDVGDVHPDHHVRVVEVRRDMLEVRRCPEHSAEAALWGEVEQARPTVCEEVCAAAEVRIQQPVSLDQSHAQGTWRSVVATRRTERTQDRPSRSRRTRRGPPVPRRGRTRPMVMLAAQLLARSRPDGSGIGSGSSSYPALGRLRMVTPCRR